MVIILHHSNVLGDVAVVDIVDETHLKIVVKAKQKQMPLIATLDEDFLRTIIGDIRLTPEDLQNINEFFKQL